MSQTFQSAPCSKGIWMPYLLITGLVSVVLGFQNLWTGIGVFAVCLAYFLDICRHTTYTISGHELHIRSGVFYKTTIDIGSIRRIAEGGAAYKGPAPSLDRLEIVYKKDRVVVSPADKKAFVSAIMALNPGLDFRASGRHQTR